MPPPAVFMWPEELQILYNSLNVVHTNLEPAACHCSRLFAAGGEDNPYGVRLQENKNHRQPTGGKIKNRMKHNKVPNKFIILRPCNSVNFFTPEKRIFYCLHEKCRRKLWKIPHCKKTPQVVRYKYRKEFSFSSPTKLGGKMSFVGCNPPMK